MLHKVYSKQFLLGVLIACILLTVGKMSYSQNLTFIPHGFGTQTIGNRTITVKYFNGALLPVTGPCSFDTNTIGRVHQSKRYILSEPTSHIRFRLGVFNDSEEVTIKVNGIVYPLTLSNISAYAGTCSCPFYVNVSNGNAIYSGPGGGSNPTCFQIDVQHPRIDSIDIIHNGKGAGSHILTYFSTDTICYVADPYADTVHCPADSFGLVYGTNFPFKTGNTFVAQLSDASGSFSNPVTLGSLSTTMGDTIPCYIPANTPTGNGYKIRLLSTNPAYTSPPMEVSTRIKNAADNFSATSNTPVCTGDTIYLMGNTTTASGLNFSWTGPNGFNSAAQDTFVVNPGLNAAGNYILTVNETGTACTAKDTATVAMSQTPNKPSASYSSPACATKSLNLSGSSTTGSVSWGWTGPNSYSSSSQNPTVTTFANSSHAGDYVLTTTLGSCSNRDTVTVAIIPKPAMPAASAVNTTLCARQDLQLQASNISGASYNWFGPAGFSITAQNPVIGQIAMGQSGVYSVYAVVNGCPSDTDDVTISVKTDPYVTIFPTPGTSICDGQEAVFTAVANNAGSSPQYQWLLNNTITGITTATYKTSALNNNDVVHCQMISTGVCTTPFTDTSNPITMTVLQTLAPSVSITATPNTSLFPNEPVSFTATPADAGNRPDYQWLRNGVPVGGATSSTWGANANFLSDGDEICAMIYSDYECPSPDSAKSNCIRLQIRVSVENINTASNIKIYPNPTSDHLFIKGADKGTAISLYDVTGRLVYQSVTEQEVHSMSVSQLPAGHYILQLTDANGNRSYSKVNKE